MATQVKDSEKFSSICIKLSWHTTTYKLKQLKFLLQDVTTEIDIHDQKSFLELIGKLENKEILNRHQPGRNEALLLCEMFDAISLPALANEICSEFRVEKDPRCQTLSVFRKFLVKLSDDLNQAPFIEKMKEYLRNEGHDVSDEDVCPLDIFQKMIQTYFISPNELSKLTKMMEFCSRNDLTPRIDEFINNRGVFRKVPHGLRALPRDMVERPSEVNEVLKLLTEGNSRVGVVGKRSGDVIGIRGMGGLGKTVLAQAIAWAVSRSRQVIWLDIGQNPDCLALINTLIKALGGAVSFSDIPTAQDWVKENTVDKDCLVVLDDVWDVDDASVFDRLSGKCQLLVTTRDSDVVRGLQGSALYELKIMAKDKSRTLLYQSAGVTSDEQSKFSLNMQRIVAELLDQCRGLPLALALVGSNLIDSRAEQQWQDVLDDLKNSDLEELRSIFSADAYPHDNLLVAINVSFQRLEESSQEKFLDFAIFPEDTDIPSDILELFWSSEGAGRTVCTPRAARRTLEKLERKSLVQKGPELQGKYSYRVHDLLLDFARAKLQAAGMLTKVQHLFLDTLRGQCENGDWAKFQGNKDYYFRYLPYHLNSSKQCGELLQLVFSFHWLEQKVKQTNLPSLLSDFRFLDEKSYEIKLLKSSLMLSADVIEKIPDSIGWQLLGRLLSYADEYPSVKTLLEHVRETCEKTCHLLPLFSCLSEPVGPLIKIFSKFNEFVYSLATHVSATGTVVISALGDSWIKVHELETGKELQVLQGHTMAVYCLALSHSGTILASGSYDTTTVLWNMDSYKQLLVLCGEGGYVNALDFSSDDQRLFTGSNDGKLRVWCVATGEQVKVIDAHDEHIRGLCTTKDGQFIATASLDNTIKLFQADTLQFVTTLAGHTDTVYSVVATRTDNPMLVSASGDKTLKIWDLRTYKEVRTLCGHQSDVYSVAVSPDTKHIVSGGLDMIVRLWCFHTGESLFCYKGHSQSVRFVTFAPDGCKALSGSQDKSFRVWDLDTSAYRKQDRSRGHSEGVIDIAVSRDGSRCVSGSMDGTFKIWKCETSKECFTLKGGKRRAVNVAISADCRYVVSLGKDSVSSLIKVWDLLDGSEIAKKDQNNEPRIVRFSSDGTHVIIGCNNNHIFIWDWKNFDIPLKLIVLPAFTTMDIVCDENMIYTCSRNMEVCQIDLGSLEVSTFSQGPYPNCTSMVVLPDGKAILSGITTENSFIYWELSSRREVKYSAGHSDDSIVTAIDITSNGKFALTGSCSGTLSLVNLESSEIVQRFTKAKAGVGIRLVSMLNDNVRFVFVDEENRIESRTINNNETGVDFVQPDVEVTCIAGLGLNYIMIGCENGELVLYDCGGNRHFKHQAHFEAVSKIKSHPSNEFLFLVSGSSGGSVKFWYVTKTVPPLWSPIWSHNVHEYPITAIAFVPNSEDIMVGSYGSEVHRVNATGIVHTYKFKCYRIAALRVVEDSLIAAFVHSFSAVKWSLNDGQLIKEFHSGAGREQFLCVDYAFKLAASKGSHHSLLIWNLQTGRALHRLRGHTHDIRALAFVPGGEFVLSGSRDKTLKLWNLRNGQFVEEFHFERFIRAIACASNGIVCIGLQGGQVCFLRLNKLSSPPSQLEQYDPTDPLN